MSRSANNHLLLAHAPLLNNRFCCKFCPYTDRNQTRAKNHLIQHHPHLISPVEDYNGQQRSRQKNKNNQWVNRDQFQRLKSQIEMKISYTSTTRSTMNYIKQLLSEMNEQIKNALAKNLFKVIGAMSLSELKNKQHCLRTNINNAVQSIDFRNILRDWCYSIKQTQELVIAELQKEDATGPTVSRHKKGFQILRRFSYEELYFQFNVLDEVYSLSSYQVRCFRDTYNKIRAKLPTFSLPPLPKIEKNRLSQNNQNKRKRISLQIVKAHVHKCFEEQRYTTGVDIWFVTCLGLRKSEILRAQIQAQGKFVSALRITQRKNKNTTLRIIPDSLCKLANYFKISYPISKERFKEVRKYCLSNIGAFYILRHTCISNLVRSLFQLTSLARFHQTSDTSLKFYIDTQSIPLIDSAFHLEGVRQKCGSSELRMKKIIELGPKKRLLQFEKQELKPFNFELFDLYAYDDAVSKSNSEFSVEYESIENLVREEVKTASLVEERYNQGSIGARDFINALGNELEQFIFYNEQEELEKHSKTQENQIELILSSQKFKISEFSSLNVKEKPIPQINNALNPKLLLKKIPSCPQCIQELSLSTCDLCEGIKVVCILCSWQKHQCCFDVDTNPGELKIGTNGKNFKYDAVRSVRLSSKQNNIKDRIIKRGFIPFQTTQTYFSDKFPFEFDCNYAIANQILQAQLQKIEYSEDFLPLTIRQSAYGDGVFVETQIPKNCILCTYRGEYKTNDETPFNSDSIWDIGWIGKKNIVIDPSKKANIGRFINCKNSAKDQNCSPYIAITSNKIFIFFVSTKKIKKDEELLYFYGPKYWQK